MNRKEKPITLSKLLSSLILGCLAFTACRKESSSLVPPTAAAAQTNCIVPFTNPAGKAYDQDSVVNFVCTQSFCGILPLNSRNYWIYEDSIFTDGVFTKTVLDTLRFDEQMVAVQDGSVWWKPSMSVGLPNVIFANDSSLFVMTERLFTPGYMDAKKEFGLFAGDSIRYLANFDDYAAQGRGLKISGPVDIEGSKFNGVLYFEKLARNYRRDQVWFLPGVGVLKYTHEQANNGFPRVVRLQKISTLVAYHLE